MLSRYRGRLVPIYALLAVLALSGCAAERAQREGERLLAQNQFEAGLNKLGEARRLEPEQSRYQIAYLRERERAGSVLNSQAEQALARGQEAEARALWTRVLALEPGHERARTGLLALDAQARHARVLANADTALANGDAEGARRLAAQVLVEQPEHAGARRLQQAAEVRLPTSPGETQLIEPLLKQPITIEFKEAPLKQAFDIISRGSGLNFVFDRDVKADVRTTLYLRNTTVAAALHYLLLTNQLEQQVMDANTVLIYPNVAAKAKEYQSLRVRNFYLAYADAKSVSASIKSLFKVRDLAVDEKLNLVMVRDTADVIELVAQQVALLDVAEPEVMLDVEILEVKRSSIMDLGVAWPQNVTFAPLSSYGGGPITLDMLRHLRSDQVGVTGVSVGINANRNEGDSNTLAHPRIRVRNREKAKVVIGDKIPNITTTVSPGAGGFASESVNYLDVGLTLNVEPTVYLNDEVAIRINMEVSNLVGSITTKSGTTAYQIGTRQAGTLLQLRDGENQVLAGLINNDERSSGNKLPGLGNLPVLGRLFGSQRDEDARTEIVLSITPHLIRNIRRPALAQAEFAAGTDVSARRRPDVTVRQPTPPAQAPAAPVSAVSTSAPGAVTAAVTLPPAPLGTPAAPAEPIPASARPAEAAPPASTEEKDG